MKFVILILIVMSSLVESKRAIRKDLFEDTEHIKAP